MSPDEGVSDGYFNNLTQQVSNNQEQQAPKSKRVACVLCRKRKLRCDGSRPSCGTCTRLSHTCAYDEVRKKSGPKRGYVKELEARLAQVETLLKTHDGPDAAAAAAAAAVVVDDEDGMSAGLAQRMPDMRNPSVTETLTTTNSSSWTTQDLAYNTQDMPFSKQNMPSFPSQDLPWTPNFSLLATGLDEPLPPPEVCAELTDLYFTRSHTSSPILNRPRFLMAMQNSSPALRPRLSLQYAVWTLGASSHPKYADMVDTLYRRARHYLERDEMSGVGENMVNMATVQAWQCVATYEFKMMYFPRAWLSTGRNSRLALMMGLHRVDGHHTDAKQCIPPPKDWIEKEERRRLFWITFAGDRYASIGTGWPMVIDEADIQTNLPSSEEAYESGIPEPSISIQEALSPGGADTLTPTGLIGVIASFLGRNLLHLHRQSPDQDDADINGEFWKRHRQMDGTILSLLLGLPESLRLPLAAHDPKVVFSNMCIHTSVICLHQAAIFKVEKHRLSAKLAAESKMRCLTAAAEISSLMKMTSHLDMAQTNPFMAFCLYVAARVFIQYLKSRMNDDTAKSSLHFLLSALQASKRVNPLAESFIAQLDVDLEVAGFDELRSLKVRAARSAHARAVKDLDCPLADENDPNQRLPTFGDGGLAQHSQPTRQANRPEPADVMSNHQGNFKGIFPVRMNISSENSSTTDTSPRTLGSSDADVMELCGNFNTPQTLSNQAVSPSDSASSGTNHNQKSTLNFRQSSNNWQSQYQHQAQMQTQTQMQQSQIYSLSNQQQQQQQQQQRPQEIPIVSSLLPHSMSEFTPSEFLDFSKGMSSTTTALLDLNAVMDEQGQLFQLSDVEWGQVMNGGVGGGVSFGEDEFSGVVRGDGGVDMMGGIMGGNCDDDGGHGNGFGQWGSGR